METILPLTQNQLRFIEAQRITLEIYHSAPTLRAYYEEAFHRQRKYVYLLGYIFAQVYQQSNWFNLGE